MNFEHWTNIVANLVTSLGVLSFIGFYLAHRQTENQFKFTVMLSCIDRFQQLSPIVRGDSGDLSRLKKYVDLTNEEFFYFQREYIPKEVIVEWMDSIVDLFPISIDGSDLPINYDRMPFKQIYDEKMLEGYPRLKKAFTLNGKNDLADKGKLIKSIAANLGISLKDKHFRRALILRQ